ncbi:Rha family transcriptional regulator [Escherichia coli]|nr:Rha family transcriptional regulator [Escherichia coli]
MNSLTANNRLSQQLVVSVSEHLLLRHECRLPNHLAVSNHRELYLTVGGELCRNLTAGFVTEEDFMFMLFVGSQKHSALSIFAKTTHMSALVLCGNSGVILLSVKDHQHIDSGIPGRYTVQAPYKAGAGIGVLEMLSAIYDAPASFLSSASVHTQIMVGWTGAPKGAPVSDNAGYANPVQFTTSEIGVSGGEGNSLLSEAAIMATIPTLTQPEIAIVDGQAVTSSLAVANFFSKRHDDVLKKIRTLECSASFTSRNFSVSDYTDCTGRKLPCYQITRDGFAFLAMGFTGKRAAQFKEAYINAFNLMEKQLSKPSVPSDVAHNASVLYSYISSIHQVWLQQLYPMLAKAESPLAVSLYDYINDASALACLINLSLNPSEVRGRK